MIGNRVSDGKGTPSIFSQILSDHPDGHAPSGKYPFYVDPALQSMQEEEQPQGDTLDDSLSQGASPQDMEEEEGDDFLGEESYDSDLEAAIQQSLGRL